MQIICHMRSLFFYCPDCDTNKNVKVLNVSTDEIVLNCPACSCCYSVTIMKKIFTRQKNSKPLKFRPPKKASFACSKCSNSLIVINSRNIIKEMREYYCYCPACKLTPKITIALKETLISFKKP